MASVTEFIYQIPDAQEHPKYMEYINEMPGTDNPPIFGLHPNADLTFSLKDSIGMINTMLDTQPKDAGGGGGLSREDTVKEKIEKELLPQLPPDINPLDTIEKLRSLKGPKGLGESGKYDLIPLNIFLSQELQRFQMVLGIVRGTMISMMEAIDGNISMTPEIVDSINQVYDFRVPRKWQYDPTGAEISWLTVSLAGWIKGLLDRYHQLNGWISKERPPSFWLTGFFNPQGFLTSMKQEVTRQRKAQNWSLDEVVYTSEVLKDVIQGDDGRIEGKTINPPNEGVYIHGLYLEGSGWNRAEKRLEDSNPKELYYQFPILHVSAVSTAIPTGGAPGAGQAARQRAIDAEKALYSCPVYKYPMRNDRYLIFRTGIKAEQQGAP
jgi:dynein heavy chain